MDIVTVFHNNRNFDQAIDLHKRLIELEGDGFTFSLMDNSIDNKGFSKACNIAAMRGNAEVIGFINPDVQVEDNFIERVYSEFEDEELVITGGRHGKSQSDLRVWGVSDWVCGCTMFVRRSFFEEVGGFDEQFVWSFEDTDLCRQAEFCGKVVRSIDLPLHHESPQEDNRRDSNYKKHHFAMASGLYYKKWRR